MEKQLLTPRQVEIASLVARGLPDKVIAARTDLSIETVKVHIQRAASRLPGDGRPRYKLMLWFLELPKEEKAG